ncbi:MAG: iron-siderophore ABC transporter substrate-binding protein [Spirochaetaceae bacterium]|jgi:iron complex transport system substrate-binding protein|nr:iron-siderophore ABC transporter substrate-binding protein [Spirochaetaceae bacterium]
MKRNTLKSPLPLLCAAILLVAAAACRGKTAPAASPPRPVERSVENSGFPLSISHAFGETVLERKPERIVTIAWGNQDVPLALGIAPVGMSEANYGVLDGSGLLPWTRAKLDELGAADYVVFRETDGLDFEAINAVSPDVILAGDSGLTREEYDTLSEIAPTIAYPGKPWQTLWRDQIMQDARGMGMEAEGAGLIAELDAFIVKTLEKYPQLKGKTAAFCYFPPTDFSTFSFYAPSDPRCAFLLDLGMVIPNSILKLNEGNDSFYLEVSSENADLMSDVDIILTWGDEGLLEALQADPLLGSIPAVRRNSFVMLQENPIGASQTPSALSIPWSLDEYVSLIAKAADMVQ